MMLGSWLSGVSRPTTRVPENRKLIDTVVRLTRPRGIGCQVFCIEVILETVGGQIKEARPGFPGVYEEKW